MEEKQWCINFFYISIPHIEIILVDISVHLVYGKVQPNVSPRNMKSHIKVFTQDRTTRVLITSVVISKQRRYILFWG